MDLCIRFSYLISHKWKMFRKLETGPVLGRPGQRICGGHILYDQRAFLSSAVPVSHEFSKLHCRREIEAVGILKCPERTALVHKLFNFAKDLITDLVRKRNKGKTANDVTDLSDTRPLVYGPCIDRVTTGDGHIGKTPFQQADKVAVELDTEIREFVRYYLLKEFCDRPGPDAQFKHSIIPGRRNARDHFLSQFGRAWPYRTNLRRILQECLQELNIFVHPHL